VNFSKIDKVVDEHIKHILQTRLQKFGNKPKEAFKDVQQGEKSLKWYEDEGLERPILSARCFTGLSAVVPVKKDESGNDIGFVKPGNNHHIAIYTDKNGNKTEHVCSFWHAVERKKYSIPVVIKNTDEVWNKIWAQPENTYLQNFLKQLPSAGLDLELSMQQNEMFILGMTNEDVKAAIENRNYKLISKHLYRVQKLSTTGYKYMFRHHLETQLVDDKNAQKSKRFIGISSLNGLFSFNPFKVKIDCLGNIKSE
jgi:CRISPR-associated endonuclease Csn1